MSMNMNSGPSAYALEVRWKIYVVLIMQTIYIIGKFTMADYVGGLLTTLIVGIGYYAVSNDMDMRWLMFWCMFGIMSAIYALADFIRVFLASSPGGFSALMSGDPWLMWSSVIILLGPFCFLCPVYYCYHIYQNADGGGSSGAYPGERQRLTGARAAPAQNFRAFEGSGQKLGTV
jgi:hypothetical protein